jgi:GT2 family glycosyltransferase
MHKIAINLVRYNQPENLITECLTAALAQDHPDFTIQLTENGSTDSIEAGIMKRFGNDHRFKYVDNGKNLGFAGAHNKFFAESDAELVMPLNPDAIMQSGFLSALAKAFVHPNIAAAEGKMLKPTPAENGNPILDGTGIVVSRTRRARERGQLHEDHGQYDILTRVFGVSGTVPLYRKSALDAVKMFNDEYFDEDFFMYWEDFDLSWRLRLAGFECAYVPSAVVFHERVGGQTKQGYKRPFAFAKHHRKFAKHILRYNWRNHLFAIIKNDFGSSLWRDVPFIVGREIAMLGYIIVFEPSTLAAFPGFFRLLPQMLKKRAIIQRNRKVTSEEIGKWFLQQQS